jgi:hypothetical protein
MLHRRLASNFRLLLKTPTKQNQQNKTNQSSITENNKDQQ